MQTHTMGFFFSLAFMYTKQTTQIKDEIQLKDSDSTVETRGVETEAAGLTAFVVQV